MLLRLPPDYAVVYSSALHWWERLSRAYYGFDVARRKRTPEAQQTSEALAVTLDTNSFITVPVRFGSQSVGRLYLTAQRRHAFHDSDIDFLLQVIEHVIPAIDNIRLVDQLASTAAEEERQRIARDIHDSVIQPYIGLQIGLAALRWKFTSGATEMTRDVERLIEMTSIGIDDLRRYVSKLKETGEHEGSLLSAIRRFARKFTEWTGIAVQVTAKTNVRVNDRLAAEAFQIVAEGLSNIRRHTHAVQATISLGCRNGQLILGIEDNRANGVIPEAFTPHSITERSLALGGKAYVERHDAAATRVVVEIPL